MCTGALAGCTAALATTPFDVVKTRLQTQAALGAAAGAAQQGGVVGTLTSIVRAEGPMGLYRRVLLSPLFAGEQAEALAWLCGAWAES